MISPLPLLVPEDGQHFLSTILIHVFFVLRTRVSLVAVQHLFIVGVGICFFSCKCSSPPLSQCSGRTHGSFYIAVLLSTSFLAVCSACSLTLRSSCSLSRAFHFASNLISCAASSALVPSTVPDTMHRFSSVPRYYIAASSSACIPERSEVSSKGWVSFLQYFFSVIRTHPSYLQTRFFSCFTNSFAKHFYPCLQGFDYNRR